jgi:glycosyltransferase involved in cell wall biosynthesis
MAKIVLFIPSRIYGGAERQMALLACQAADDGHEVTLIDSKVGIVSSMITARDDIEIKIFDGTKRVEVSNSVVITQASYAFCLGGMLDMTQCDVRFWFMHPLNLPHMFLSKRLGPLLGKVFKKIFTYLYYKKLLDLRESFFFQSNDTHVVVEDFYGINIPNISTGLLSEKREVTSLNVGNVSAIPFDLCWLGRLDNGSKLLVVKQILSDLTNSKFIKSTSVLHIVGDGPARLELEVFAAELGLNQKVKFHGHVDYDMLPSLIEKCILVFAHGTSVYEGVYCHVPVAVVDFYTNSNQLQEMKYRLYSDDSDLTLGYLINDHLDPRILTGRSLDEIIEEIMNPQLFKNITQTQLEKLERSRNIGIKGCRSLYGSPYSFTNQNNDVLLDRLFFSLRGWLIRLRNQRV